MKIKDIYGLDDNIEHFVIHSAEEEFSSVEIKNVKISRTKDGIKFEFFCERHDKEVKPGLQQDLIDKLQKRVDKYHKNFITNVEILVYQE